MAPNHPFKAGILPSRKDQMAFMAMMDSVIQNQFPCNCSTCSKRPHSHQPAARRSNVTHQEGHDQSAKSSPTVDESKHLCPEHKDIQTSKRSPSSEKKPPNSPANQNRNDKVNSLLKAETIQAVFDIFKLTPTTKEEKQLSQQIQTATSDCKLFADTRNKILDLCSGDDTDSDAVFGLLAKFRQERNLLTTAIIKSNAEREKSLLAIQRVDHLMYMLQDVAKEGKDSTGAEVRGNLGNIILEIHEIAKTPSVLYDELLDLREEHLDLLADHEEEHQKFLDIESCHETLHEKNKKLQEDHSQLAKDHTDAKKKLSSVGGMKNDISRLEKLLEKSNTENVELRKEIDKLTSEMGKVNALKHENAQLKKKLTASETRKEEPQIEPAASTKKKKGKKSVQATAPIPEQIIDTQDRPPQSDKVLTEQMNLLKAARDELTSELDLVRGDLKQLEAMLKKTETARDRAVEKHQLEAATAQNWRELSEGHSDESARLREQLEQSLSNATTLQNNVHQLEQSLAEAKERLQTQAQKEAPTPELELQSSSTSRIDADMLRLLHKVRNDTGQLVHDLNEARSYSGDPRNVIAYTTKIVAELEQDLGTIVTFRKEHDNTIQPVIPETFVPYQYANLTPPLQQIPPNMARFSDLVPNTSPANVASMPPPSMSPYRPIAPPGLGGIQHENVNPRAHQPSAFNTSLPAPVGTGRPSSGRIGPSTSKIQSSSPVSTQGSTMTCATSTFGSGIGNGAAGVDWSMWARPK